MLNKDTLKFACARCGNCCTFKGGYVWVSINEIREMARKLRLSKNDFGRKYLRKLNGQYSLIEKSDGPCIMYKDGGCSLYDVRPKQCRDFPYWPENISSKEAWERVGKMCKGIL